MRYRQAPTRKPKWPPEAVPHNGTYYDSEVHDALVFNLRLLFGGSMASISQALGVSEGSIRAWRRDHPSFAAAWRQGGEEAQANVARALYRSAIGGHTVRTEKAFYDSKTGQVVKAEIREQIAPSVPAQLAFLANRAPSWWRTARTSNEITGPDGEPLTSLPPVIVVEAVWGSAPPVAIEPDHKTIDSTAIWRDTD